MGLARPWEELVLPLEAAWRQKSLFLRGTFYLSAFNLLMRPTPIREGTLLYLVH